MQLVLLLLFCLSLAAPSHSRLLRDDTYSSVDAFVTTLQRYKPADAAGEILALFTVPEPGQPHLPETGRPITAERIQSVAITWRNAERALVFVTARPPTNAADSAVGVLFLVSSRSGRWGISDLRKFTALGKYADHECHLTA